MESLVSEYDQQRDYLKGESIFYWLIFEENEQSPSFSFETSPTCYKFLHISLISLMVCPLPKKWYVPLPKKKKKIILKVNWVCTVIQHDLYISRTKISPHD